MATVAVSFTLPVFAVDEALCAKAREAGGENSDAATETIAAIR
jgi:hypothetical protein